MKKQHKLYLHIFIWVYWLLIYWILYDSKYFNLENDKSKYFIQYLFNRGLLISLFYVQYLLLIPYFLLKKKVLIYFSLTICFICLGMAFHSVIWNGNNLDFFFNWRAEQCASLFFEEFYMVLIPLGFTIIQAWLPSEIKKRKLKEELKFAELQFLKSQMSPHFLFNTLNNIYGLSLKKDDKTAKALNELKNIMSYVELMESHQKISLTREIGFLNDFISLNKLRYMTNIEFDIEKSLDMELEIEPMLLLPLIENAFKHGVNDANGFLRIKLWTEEETLLFKVENDFDTNKRKDEVSGVGLKNIKRRLEMIYVNNFKFVQSIENSIFISLIAVPINEK